MFGPDGWEPLECQIEGFYSRTSHTSQVISVFHTVSVVNEMANQCKKMVFYQEKHVAQPFL